MKSLQIFNRPHDTYKALISGVFDDVGFFQDSIFWKSREKNPSCEKKKVQGLNLLHEFSIRQDQQNQFFHVFSAKFHGKTLEIDF